MSRINLLTGEKRDPVTPGIGPHPLIFASFASLASSTSSKVVIHLVSLAYTIVLNRAIYSVHVGAENKTMFLESRIMI
jgi:hypothetical protein